MCSELLLDYENVGCEQILIDARKIMADKKVCNDGEQMYLKYYNS